MGFLQLFFNLLSNVKSFSGQPLKNKNEIIYTFFFFFSSDINNLEYKENNFYEIDFSHCTASI